MKKTIKMMSAAAVCMLLTMTSCQEAEEVVLGSISVTLTPVETYDGVDVSGVSVTLTNNVDNTTSSATTDASGVALFENLSFSTYNATAIVELSADQAVAYTGLNSEVTLSGSANNISVVSSTTVSASIELDGSTGGSLVIKEIYCTGAANDSYSIMFKDQFIEIYNNSDEIQYVDGLYILECGNSSVGTDASNDVAFGLSNEDYVYANKVIQFPGNGTDYPVEPGQSVIVAVNAVDYLSQALDAGLSTVVTVDNSTADFDTYFVDWMTGNGATGSSYFDVDNSEVPTMVCHYHNNSYGYFNMPNYPGMALAKMDSCPTETTLDPASPTSTIYYLMVPASSIIDAIDILATTAASELKRFNSTIDSGFYSPDQYTGDDTAVTGGYYSGNSYRRKISKTMDDGRNVLSDTNNSTIDMEIIATPDPRGYNN